MSKKFEFRIVKECSFVNFNEDHPLLNHIYIHKYVYISIDFIIS